ncbi:SDR family NAD(P)-dependent oxidoreductase [Rhodobacter sp. 24-YEA-8]|uniref:SDR family NAD(P)-dependent oxidoreductase n=1 Tax=Rhodobacter sp. 24-YEA-8 TaxID=1884310 RepID=UPI00089D2496|nr:SDR family NAD(P)-dependent oxidoreductase [Rhodobacter sp. 24-YEA-8]SEC72199.1 NAD(P)-dependent dehydrogenase, short-chain alcohol dehydrogenase family [Rhodobacter sp. 24-YEA-8]
MSPPVPRAVAIVTGGLSGIGHAVALDLAARGYRVVVGARDLESRARLDAFGALTGAAIAGGGEVRADMLDLTDPGSVAGFCERTTERFGPADVLINAAGITAEQPVEGHGDALWQSIIDTNLTGAFRMIRACLPGMKARRWGRIVNIGSTAATIGWKDNPAYCASKAGLLGLTRCVALEGASHGVTCVMVSPTWVDTPMMASDLAQVVAREGLGRSVEEARAAIAAENPQGRIIQPGEVAELVAFLITDAAKGITMEEVKITGGALW